MTTPQKRHHRFKMFGLLAALSLMTKIAASAPLPPAESPVKAQNMTLQVMTFNLRYANAREAPDMLQNTWAQRRPVTKALLSLTAPDLIGTQEGLYGQIKDIAADNPEYAWIGQGRSGGSRGEFMAVFYRQARFEPLEFDHFWLSDTPAAVASSTWGNNNIRMVTWVKFRDRQTNREFYFLNTHLDHISQSAREKSAALILERVGALQTTLPVVLTGDFNVPAGENQVYDILTGTGGFSDTWTSAARRIGPPANTFHGYKPTVFDGKRIDWILSRGALLAESSEVVTFEKAGQRPSDHFPVVATLRFSSEAPN